METELFSPQTEEKILALFMHNSGYLDSSNIKSEMFSSIQNRIIFNTLKELDSKGEIDLDLMIEYLNGKNLLDKAGGASYIKYLFQVEYDLNDFINYSKILISSYKLRVLLSIVKDIKRDSITFDNVDNKINWVVDSLENLNSMTSDDITLDLYSALKLSWAELQNKIDKNGLFGIPFGVENIDSVIGGIDRGDLWIIGARPSMGKTALMCNSALKTAEKGTKVLILSLEMGRQAIIERILAIKTGIPVFNLRLGILDQKDLDIVSKAIQEIKNLPIYINTKFVPDLSYVESIIRNKKSSSDIDLVYLDYIQLLTSRDEDSTQELGRISQKLKMLARDLKVGMCVLSQLSRDLEKRPSKRPVMSDLRQSGYLEEDADLVAFLYRESVYNPSTQFPNTMEFIIRKQRNGNIGTIPLTFEAETNRIY